MSRFGPFCRVVALAGLAFLVIGNGARVAASTAIQRLVSNQTGNQFGAAVAVGKDVIAVGAYLSDEGGKDSGAVYLFRKIGNDWKAFDVKPLYRENAVGEWFGFDVAVDQDGKVLVVGAPSPGRGSGKVFKYDLNFNSDKGKWEAMNERQLLVQSAQAGDEFGSAVAIDSNLIAVGARGADRRAGRAYVFPLSGEPKTITSPKPVPGREFGQAIGLSGNTLVVGEPLPGQNGESPGTAHIFKQGDDSEWIHQDGPKLPGGLAAGSAFGYSVAVQGERVIAGAPLADHSAGAVYRLIGGTWEALQSDAQPGDQLGVAIGMSGNEAVIGARGTKRGTGAAYLYSWGGKPKPLDHEGIAKAEFGFGVTTRGDVTVVGAFKEGAAYVFETKLPIVQKVMLQFDQGGRKVESLEVEEGKRVPVKLVLVTTESLLNDVIVAVQATNGNSSQEEDYSPESVTIKFAKGSTNGTAKPVDIQALSDCDANEEEETFVLSSGIVSGAVLEELPSSLRVRILDADLAANLIVTPASLATRELAPPKTFSVKLACAPRSPVRVDLTSSDEDAGTVSVLPLWFNTRNWSESQEVLVTGKNNEDCRKSHPYSVNINTSSVDPLYDNLNKSVPLNNLNDDICLTAAQSVCVNGGTVLYTIVVENTGEEAYSAGNKTIVELPVEVTVVTASADHGVATVDYVQNGVTWSGKLPGGSKARIDVLAQLEAVPDGTEVNSSAVLPYDTDGNDTFDAAVETNQTVFQAGDVIPCLDPPNP